MSATYRFPSGFLWGAATSSHQVEGNNRWNDWWEFEQSGILPYASGNACEHFERYESDFDLASSWGHNAHRLSIEWSRIEPTEGEFDAAALDHYVKVVAALRERCIEPVVTLHHFTNPAWFTRRGGWTNPESIELFARYVSAVASRLAEHVRFWLTINEPTVYVMRAYVKGDWPPCQPGSWLRAWRVLRNLCRAHVSAYAVIHEYRADAMVGLAHSAPYVVPHDPHRWADRFAARMRDFALNDLCFHLVGRHRALDFIGINYYVRQVVQWRPRGSQGFVWGRAQGRRSSRTAPVQLVGMGSVSAGTAQHVGKVQLIGRSIDDYREWHCHARRRLARAFCRRARARDGAGNARRSRGARLLSTGRCSTTSSGRTDMAHASDSPQ